MNRLDEGEFMVSAFLRSFGKEGTKDLGYLGALALRAMRILPVVLGNSFLAFELSTTFPASIFVHCHGPAPFSLITF